MKRSAVPPGASIRRPSERCQKDRGNSGHDGRTDRNGRRCITLGRTDGRTASVTPNTTVNCSSSTILSPTMLGRWRCAFVGQAFKPFRCRVRLPIAGGRSMLPATYPVATRARAGGAATAAHALERVTYGRQDVASADRCHGFDWVALCVRGRGLHAQSSRQTGRQVPIPPAEQ
jgi:hypothetical protein